VSRAKKEIAKKAFERRHTKKVGKGGQPTRGICEESLREKKSCHLWEKRKGEQIPLKRKPDSVGIEADGGKEVIKNLRYRGVKRTPP